MSDMKLPDDPSKQQDLSNSIWDKATSFQAKPDHDPTAQSNQQRTDPTQYYQFQRKRGGTWIWVVLALLVAGLTAVVGYLGGQSIEAESKDKTISAFSERLDESHLLGTDSVATAVVGQSQAATQLANSENARETDIARAAENIETADALATLAANNRATADAESIRFATQVQLALDNQFTADANIAGLQGEGTQLAVTVTFNAIVAATANEAQITVEAQHAATSTQAAIDLATARAGGNTNQISGTATAAIELAATENANLRATANVAATRVAQVESGATPIARTADESAETEIACLRSVVFAYGTNPAPARATIDIAGCSLTQIATSTDGRLVMSLPAQGWRTEDDLAANSEFRFSSETADGYFLVLQLTDTTVTPNDDQNLLNIATQVVNAILIEDGGQVVDQPVVIELIDGIKAAYTLGTTPSGNSRWAVVYVLRNNYVVIGEVYESTTLFNQHRDELLAILFSVRYSTSGALSQ